ncbi:dihydrofolate reductase family protein [Serinicoccus kebangsaanensis]|uniref:dihydrofolate reductase family protein n=1 Tax=Serinicoccus kebangsaanensis TaxID=2602069 RepID=UPI00192DA85D|nr:dihydrofolate reductase family protein [Serinicoccus kebangsaanensis]
MSEAELARWYAPPDGVADDAVWVRGSFITTLDGRVTGPGGRSGGLNAGSEGDHAAFAHLRRWADVVVVAAGTARAEGYGPLQDCALLVVTRSGDVPPQLRSDPGVLVLGGDGQDVPPDAVLEVCARRGWRRVVVEGGPELFGPWVAQGAVDELCLTVRPVLTGGAGPLVVPAEVELGGLVGEASHLLEWGGDLLLRVRLDP